jgi:hypothetical protein
MNVKRIEGSLLNFWVAKSVGLKILTKPPLPGEKHDPDNGHWHPQTYHPATDWSHAGPIVSNEWYVIEDTLAEWFGPDWTGAKAIKECPLLWFMRAFVASQFGDQLEDIGGADVSQAPNAVTLAQLQLDTLRTLRETQ